MGGELSRSLTSTLVVTVYGSLFLMLGLMSAGSADERKHPFRMHLRPTHGSLKTGTPGAEAPRWVRAGRATQSFVGARLPVRQTPDGRILKLLNIVDEHTREELGAHGSLSGRSPVAYAAARNAENQVDRLSNEVDL